jgi:hypothetical protein
MPAAGMRVAQADPHAIYNSAAISRRPFGALTAIRYQLACKEAGTRSEARCYFALPLCFCTDNAAKPQSSQALKARAVIDLLAIGCRDLRDLRLPPSSRSSSRTADLSRRYIHCGKSTHDTNIMLVNASGTADDFRDM